MDKYVGGDLNAFGGDMEFGGGYLEAQDMDFFLEGSGLSRTMAFSFVVRHLIQEPSGALWRLLELCRIV